MCDIILTSPTADFGQPEINLGIIRGAGGTQRLTHLIGQSRAMEIIITGRKINASEAENWGIVTRIVPEGKNVVDGAAEIAGVTSQKGAITRRTTTEYVKEASKLVLQEGLAFEKRALQACWW
ncbi:ECH-domain-containing protein [Fomitiporia mediterranea MF3/22]|uniref:ECH-domain-containing protein n=1 Tax=Fomitiporia mediterranea (strain MF3/22) TaxID=694068 RepID=UPI00044073AC|nr:ECH-domain-containing protein [Fomitiporia mediterranea MF3/22]EJD03425.1 ECH-domain-containing protein [Fomitiporia mediterranea MF3/22]